MTENETTPNPAFPLAVGALVALGAAFVGWQAGLGLYSAIYEYLRNSGGELALDSKGMLATFRYCGWFAGAALGAFTFWRWHRSGALDPSVQRLSVKRVIVLALAGAGATHLGYLFINGASVEAMVLTALLSLIGGSVVAASFFGLQPPRFFIGRFIVAALSAFMVLWMSLAFDKGIAQRYDSVERKRDVWVRIRFPAGTQALATYKDIKVEMRTPTTIVKGFAIRWEDVDSRPYLPLNFEYTEMTNDRTLIVTMPDRPEIVIKLPFSRNPPPMHDYSPWINLDGGLSYRYRVN